MPSTWNPQQYERFVNERREPFYDLLSMVERIPGMRVVDLGCGTGELTRALHRHLCASETLGIDSSDTMLARSAAFAGDGVRFEAGDIADLDASESYDLVFSNAALHWLPNHPELIQRLTRSLAPEGQIAIQVPANHDHPSHLVADEIASEEPFRSALLDLRRGVPVLDPREYAELIYRLGYARQLVRMHIYSHELPSAEHVVEWVRGSLLTAYQRRMPEALFDQFVARYRERLLERLPDHIPYLYTYKRIMVWAAEPPDRS